MVRVFRRTNSLSSVNFFNFCQSENNRILLISVNIVIKILSLSKILLSLSLLIIKMAIDKSRTEHLADVIDDLDIVIESID